MGPKKDYSAPRIYNLFPRIVGSIDNWYKHLDRIVLMGFKWIYLNPLNYPGFSGSLYAVKDFYKFNPIFNPPGVEDQFSWDPLKEFIGACHKKKIKFMYDLVINHTALDSDLVKEHKEWYIIKCVVAEKSSGRVIMQCPCDDPPNKRHFREPAFIIEERIAHPMAIDPADARKVTIWGDLAEINNHDSPDKENLLQYWKDVVSFYLNLGIDGFRCDAAYKVPPETWKPLIEHARAAKPSTLFVAETLGCRIEELERTVMSGFDYIFNSSKYWDFTKPWLVEQYDQFRKHAPSIGFPESHDTQRLAAETGKREDVQKFRYLFSAFFSAGVMMPVGYEFGFQRTLDVVRTQPTHWEQNTFDISTFIKSVNTFKQKYRCLNEDGPVKHFNYGNKAVLVIRKTSLDGKQHMLLVYNKDWQATHEIPLDDLHFFLDIEGKIAEVGLEGPSKQMATTSWKRALGPNEYAFLFQESAEAEAK